MRKSSEDSGKAKRKDSEKAADKKVDESLELDRRGTKKGQSGFAKIKNHIEEYSFNPKKIMQFVKKSTMTIPHLLTKQQTKALLPKLEQIILPLPKDQKVRSKTKFQQIEDQLTHSMVMFTERPEIRNSDIEVIDMQTQKCYKSIPQFYFKESLGIQDITRNLLFTKEHVQIQQTVYNLMDYLDQVNFNINQQAAAKITIFMNFVLCMNSIQDLVKINSEKLGATRKHNGLLRDIIVSRCVRINSNREKKEKLKQTLDVLLIFKKMKGIENRLFAQTTLGNFLLHDPKSRLGGLFEQYCQLHNEELKAFCCSNADKRSKHICKYWEINYFLKKGFQENFIKNIRNYLFEVINWESEVEKFKKAFVVSKKNFMTTPSSMSFSEMVHCPLDESYDVDAYDHVELITKIHIEKEIVSLFEQGMYKYNLATEQLEKELQTFINAYVNSFVREALNSIGIEHPRQTLRDLDEVPDANYLQSQKFREKILKISWSHYDKLIEMVMLRLQYLNLRLLSLVEKIFIKAEAMKQAEEEKYEILSAYMVQLIAAIIGLSDRHISFMLRSRSVEGEKSMTLFKSKQEILRQFDNESDNTKKLVNYCKKWLAHIDNIRKTYNNCCEQTCRSLSKSQKNIPDGRQTWSPETSKLKTGLVKTTYELLHKTIVSRDLREALEQDIWQFIEVKAEIYNDIGYIIGGQEFLLEEEVNQRNLLSNSLLMERSISESERSAEKAKAHYNKEQYSSKFKINPNYITLANHKFRIVSSTEAMIKILRKYLQVLDEHAERNKLQDFSNKLTQVLLMYNQYIRDLILKGEAVKLGRIKTKSITAKQLVTAFIQLHLVSALYAGAIMQGRVGLSNVECLLMQEKVAATQAEIRKKYQKIIEMRIMDSIELINVKEEVMESEHFLSIPKNIQASVELFSELMLAEPEWEKFLDMDPTWAAELLNKLSKGPRGKESKLRCFGYLEEQLRAHGRHLPRLLVAIKSVLT